MAIRLVQEAVDNGITFFDNCWEYHVGKSEDWMGMGLKGARDKVFLMTKVCTHGPGSHAGNADAGAVFAATTNGSFGSMADSRREFRE